MMKTEIFMNIFLGTAVIGIEGRYHARRNAAPERSGFYSAEG